MKTFHTKYVCLILIGIMLICLATACKKGFLEEKSDKKLLVPVTLEDFQALLDNNYVMNTVPGLPAIFADDFYQTDAGMESISLTERQAYTWSTDLYQGGEAYDWNICYSQVFYSNIVLDGLKKISSQSGSPAYRSIKGAALFYRAFAFYQLAQEYTRPFNLASADADPGIPLRLEADVNKRYDRVTVNQTYQRIITDLNEALDLLPVNQTYKTRPSKTAAQSMLARVYLTMQDYTNAEHYADDAIQASPALLDYSFVPSTAFRPFPSDYPSGSGNPEVIFYTPFLQYAYFSPFSNTTLVNQDLYNEYAGNDLRKVVFFEPKSDGTATFKGSYSGDWNYTLFAGLATDENYLTRSECRLRNGKSAEALADLNLLLANRYDHQTFEPVTENDAAQLLTIILNERRKELVSRGTRWTDLRRLNQDPAHAVTLIRISKGETYELPPGDKRYTLPISEQEVRLAGIPQN